MKVVFRTNIDNYRCGCFPEEITTPPRIGEKVQVKDAMLSHFQMKSLPTVLEVVDVTYT